MLGVNMKVSVGKRYTQNYPDKEHAFSKYEKWFQFGEGDMLKSWFQGSWSL